MVYEEEYLPCVEESGLKMKEQYTLFFFID